MCDEALAVFPSPRSALLAAVTLRGTFQEEMRAEPTLPLKVGMGLDVGEVVPVQGGFRGKALNLAASLARSMSYPYAEARAMYECDLMRREQGNATTAGLGAAEETRRRSSSAAWTRAAGQLQEALGIFRRLGAEKDVAQTERALAELSVRTV